MWNFAGLFFSISKNELSVSQRTRVHEEEGSGGVRENWDSDGRIVHFEAVFLSRRHNLKLHTPRGKQQKVQVSWSLYNVPEARDGELEFSYHIWIRFGRAKQHEQFVRHGRCQTAEKWWQNRRTAGTALRKYVKHPTTGDGRSYMEVLRCFVLKISAASLTQETSRRCNSGSRPLCHWRQWDTWNNFASFLEFFKFSTPTTLQCIRLVLQW